MPVLATLACTEPAEREQLRIEIEADRAVQALIEEVSAVIEFSSPNGGWQSLDSQRFEPKLRNQWPIEYREASMGRRVNYQLTTTASDARGAVVATARARRDWDAQGSLTLRVIFENACVRLDKECGLGQTCHTGECVDARLDTSVLRPSDELVRDAGPAVDVGTDPGGPKVAAEDEACDVEGARACTGEMSRASLFCEAGVWKPSPVCSESELCDTTPGSQRGQCRAIAAECRGQMMDREFCDGDIMRVCSNMFEPKTRQCPPNAKCVSPDGQAKCDCKTGFVNLNDGMGCREPTSCADNNGGCDRLTTCSMRGATRICSACPPGYVGDGLSGCEPLLSGLSVSVGQLVPAFQPDVHVYRMRVPLLTQRVGITPVASSGARIDLNGSPTQAGQPWLSPTLQLGEYPVKLTLTAASSETSIYDIVIEREGAQSAYLKASNAAAADALGLMVAASGDTIVSGAPYEDSNASQIDGDQSNNSLDNAGAAYVFVKRGDSWEQQAYLKPTDPAAQDRFGLSSAIDGDTILLGAIRADLFSLTTVQPRPGAAYVFNRTNGKWRQTVRLSPASGSNGDLFGYNVALAGDRLAVGAPRDGGSGAVYVYARSGDAWLEEQKIKPTSPVSGGMFGGAVAISGDMLIVGSPDDGTDANKAGSAYVFVRNASTGQWTQTQRIVADPVAAGANFGYSTSISGERALIGAPRAVSIQSFSDTDPGEVFAFRRQGTTLTQTQRMRAMLPRASDSFGSSVSLVGESALVGSCGDASGAQGVGGDASRRDVSYAGAGYLFALEGDEWMMSAYLKAQHPDRLDSLGFGGALTADYAVLSAVWESSSARGINGDQENDAAEQSGALYVFQ